MGVTSTPISLLGRLPNYHSLTVALRNVAESSSKRKKDEWSSPYVHTHTDGDPSLGFFFFFYLFEEYWASLIFTSSFVILPLFSPCFQPATLEFSGLKAVRGDYRFLGTGSVLRAPGSSGPIKELEHLPGKKHPWSRQVTPVKLLGGHFPLTFPCYKSIGRIKSFNKKISGHLRALGKMACWCTTHIVWMNKEEKPNSSVMRKHLSTKSMFHKKKKKSKWNHLDTKSPVLKTEPTLEAHFCLKLASPMESIL